jgi:signal transduction histidine kinase/ligand-binding sensor domain-containing protein
MSRSSTTSVREPTFEFRSNSTVFNPALHEESLQSPPGRIASGIKSWLLLTLAVVSSLFPLSRAYALDPNRRISQYGHVVWRIEDGVAPSTSFVTQTADGYIWLTSSNRGTLIRFDGRQFVTWQPPKGTNLTGRIYCLLGSHDGSLWIGTRSGLNRLKDGKLSTITKPSDHFGVSALIEDHAGRIWLTRYRVPKSEGPLCEVGGDGLQCYGPSDGIPATYALGLTEDSAGNLWFGGENVKEWKPGTRVKQYLDSSEHYQFADVAVDHSGNVWAAAVGAGPRLGVRYFHNGIWSEYVAPGFHSSSVNSTGLFVDGAGAVWIGTENDGVYRVWGGVVDHFSRSEGLSGSTVASIFEDHEGNLWVTTESGVDLFRNTAAITYSVEQGLHSSTVNTVLAASNGLIWVGEKGGEAYSREQFADILRPGPNQRFSPGPKLPEEVGAMLEDHSGALWFELEAQLVVYKNGKIQKVLGRDGRVLDDNSIRAMVEDSSGTILALSRTKLYRIKERRVQEEISLPEGRVVGGLLAVNPNGGVWVVGRREAVMLYRDSIMHRFPLPTPTESIGIGGVVADPADLLLLATTQGLFRWDASRWAVLNESNGLPCNGLMGAIKDRHGSLWISADCGLLLVQAAELEKWRQNSDRRLSFTILDAFDGAQPGRAQNYEPMMSLARDGKIWLANGRFIQEIDPDQLYKNAVPPPVHVEQFIADNRRYEAVGSPHLPPKTHNLEVDYTGLSFSVPQKVQFRYLLEGRDKTWQEPGGRRQAFYTDLAPGNYRFHVIASNNSGVWNDIGAVASFVVEPTFYQTLWFKTLMAIAVLSVLWALYLLRLKQATANVHERLFAQMEERERIARELHDTLLQGFQGITLRMQGVSKNMPVQDPLRKMMEEVLDRADEVLREARQRVRNLRRRTTDDDELSNRLTQCGQELAKDHSATFTLAIVGEPQILESTVQDEAYRIVAEALTNAFRHASASKIETEVTYDSSTLRIRVRDDGVGMNKAVRSNGHPGHWGLAGMRERAEAIRAQFNIWSRESAGTEVELVIPAAIAYPRNQRKPIETDPFRF